MIEMLKPMQRKSLYKFFSVRHWAERFLEGELLFRSLSYFRDCEDDEVRGDRNEGSATLRPQGGLVVNNLTQQRTFTLPKSAFESSAKLEEIFVYCVSRSLNDELRDRFAAVAWVEILDIPVFCAKIQAALPTNASFPGPQSRTRIGHRVTYFGEAEAVNPRWGLPDVMATSKPAGYAWQDEFRLAFSLTDALDFEKVVTRVVQTGAARAADPVLHHEYLVKAGSLRDVCRIVPIS